MQELSSTLTYSSWDSTVRTAVFTTSADETGNIQLGDRIKFAQPTDGVKWGIVTAITSGTITLFINSDYDVDNEAVSDAYYSHAKNPYGFDLNPNKWKLTLTDSVNRSQASPVNGIWYNLGSLSIDLPIGIWNVSYKVFLEAIKSANGFINIYATLSTGASSESDTDFTCGHDAIGDNTFTGTENIGITQRVRKDDLVLTSKTTYYLNAKTTYNSIGSINFQNSSDHNLIIEAKCAYL